MQHTYTQMTTVEVAFFKKHYTTADFEISILYGCHLLLVMSLAAGICAAMMGCGTKIHVTTHNQSSAAKQFLRKA